MKVKPDKRRFLFTNENKKFGQMMNELYSTKINGKDCPLNVFTFNFTALLLNISDKNYEDAKKLYADLENSKIFIEGEKSYYIYPENKQCQYFDFAEKYFTSIVFAVSAVESYVNSILRKYNLSPPNSIHKIEKEIDLKQKIKKFLAESRKITIDVNKIKFWNDFCDLIDYRHEIIHPKSEKITAIVKRNDEIVSIKSEQIQILNKIFYEGSKRDIVESARKMIQYLAEITNFPETTPIEFTDYEFPDINKYINENRVNIEYID